MTDQRLEFEEAYSKTIVETADGKGWGTVTVTEMMQVMLACRSSDEAYLFNFAHMAPIDNILTTGMVNSAWWSWRVAQAAVLDKTQGSSGHVVH